MRILLIPCNDKIRNNLVANPMHFSGLYSKFWIIFRLRCKIYEAFDTQYLHTSLSLKRECIFSFNIKVSVPFFNYQDKRKLFLHFYLPKKVRTSNDVHVKLDIDRFRPVVFFFVLSSSMIFLSVNYYRLLREFIYKHMKVDLRMAKRTFKRGGKKLENWRIDSLYVDILEQLRMYKHASYPLVLNVISVWNGLHRRPVDKFFQRISTISQVNLHGFFDFAAMFSDFFWIMPQLNASKTLISPLA